MIQQLQAELGDQVQSDKDISHFLTIRTRTKAEYYFAAASKEAIISAIRAANSLQLPIFILGGGSNLAVLRETIPGLVIHNRYIQKEVVSDTSAYTEMRFSSGYPMSLVVKETISAGLSGFEYQLGLPGTLGGAMYMNSKWTKPVSYTSETLRSARIVNLEGIEREVTRDYFNFAYDYSLLQKTHEVFLDGVYRLLKVDPEVLKQRSQDALTYRKETQPFGVATGGCFFQNISEEEKEKNGLPTTSAGYLIDHAGLKGHRVGGFVVSEKHANFIVNTGDGKPEDLRQMIDLIAQTVDKKYGVTLKHEVVVI